MIAVARGIDRFDRRAAFTTWLYRVATNAALDEGRRKARRPRPVDPPRGGRVGGFTRGLGRRPPRRRRCARRPARGVPGRGGPARPVRSRLRRDRRGARRAPGDGAIAYRPRPFGAGRGAREPRVGRGTSYYRDETDADHDRRPSPRRTRRGAGVAPRGSAARRCHAPAAGHARARRRRSASRHAAPRAAAGAGGRRARRTGTRRGRRVRGGQPGRGRRRHRRPVTRARGGLTRRKRRPRPTRPRAPKP